MEESEDRMPHMPDRPEVPEPPPGWPGFKSASELSQPVSMNLPGVQHSIPTVELSEPAPVAEHVPNGITSPYGSVGGVQMPPVQKVEHVASMAQGSMVRLDAFKNVNEADLSIYEVKPTDEFTIKFGLKEIEGRWIVIDNEQIDVLDKTIQKHWVKFKMWTFNEELNLRKKATKYDEDKRINMIDFDTLNEYKVRFLIKDWSFGERNEKLKLFHINGYLVDQSWDVFRRLYVNIVKYIIAKMNEVLEW